jgi:hypothetical protein
MVACQLPKLNARVRFPLPAPDSTMRGMIESGAHERSEGRQDAPFQPDLAGNLLRFG